MRINLYKAFLCIAVALVTAFSLLAQTVPTLPPEGIIYQAEARDNTGKLLTNKTLEVKLIIKQESPTTGFTVWEGEYTVNTDKYGLFSLIIGEGVSNGYVFGDIHWDLYEHFLTVQLMVDGSWVTTGSLQFLSVPYAMHAGTANNALTDNVDDADADPTNELQDWSTLPGIPPEIADGDDVDDADADPENEIQELLLDGNVLTISGGNSIVLPVSTIEGSFYYQDHDDDGFGNMYELLWLPTGVSAPQGFSTNEVDCDDNNAAINPEAEEICDGVDNNCDGQIDEECATCQSFQNLYPNPTQYYWDGLLTLYSDQGCTMEVAEGTDSDQDGYVVFGEEIYNDCDDNDAAKNPEAEEICDGVDNNCDGQIDEGCDEECTSCEAFQNLYPNPTQYYWCGLLTLYSDPNCNMVIAQGTDSDHDGFVVFGEDIYNDCDDNDAAINPEAEEICDGKDNDCDGEIDEGCEEECASCQEFQNLYPNPTQYYWCGLLSLYSDPDCSMKIAEGTDSDHDGFVVFGEEIYNDCDDNDPSVYPGAEEICDGVDNDCNGQIDENDVCENCYADIIFLLSGSSSMDYERKANIRASLTSVFQDWASNKSDFNIGIWEIGDYLNPIHDMTNVATGEASLINSIEMWTPSANQQCIYEVMDAAYNHLRDYGNPEASKIVVLIIDGLPNCIGGREDPSYTVNLAQNAYNAYGIRTITVGWIVEDFLNDIAFAGGTEAALILYGVPPPYFDDYLLEFDYECGQASEEDLDQDGWTVSEGDCDDNNPDIFPGNVEITCNGIDDDCNPSTTDNPNADGDPVSLCDGDCDDNNPNIFPGNTEYCDGLDNDCVGGANYPGGEIDSDGDGYRICNGDCDDNNASVNPGASEIEDGIDNNCDGNIDECIPGAIKTVPCGCNGYMNVICNSDGEWIPLSSCLDESPITEICGDGIDNDCDGLTDNEDPDCEGPVILITEIMANQAGTESGGAGEFIELFNAGTTTVDLNNWWIAVGPQGTYSYDQLQSYQSGTMLLLPGEYAVILDPDYDNRYSFPTGTVLVTIGDATLGNSGIATTHWIAIYDEDRSTKLDEFQCPSDPGDGVSLYRISLNADNNCDNWAASPRGSSPGE